ncbi:MAG: DUF4836 family protein [Phocaeicola sp.]
MNKVYSSLWLVFVLLFLAACSPKSDYTQAIPKGATAVVAIDLQNIASKSGLSSNEGESAASNLTQLLKSGLQGDAFLLVEKIVKTPSELGLSLTDKVYLFTAPDGSAQLFLGKVSDKKKIETLFDLLAKSQICTPIREEDGCSFTQIGELLCVFNRSALFVLHSPAGHAANFKGTLFSWLRQEQGEGFTASSDFEALSQAKGEISAVINMAILPREVTMPFRMGMPATLKLEDLKYHVDISFEPGKSIVHCKSLTVNPDWQSFFEQTQQFTAPINGTLLDLFPGNTLFTFSGNFQGGKAYELLCKNPAIRQYINNPMINVEGIFRAIQGDFVLGYSSLATAYYLGYAEVTHTDFLQSIEALRPLLALTAGQMQLNSLGVNQYEFRSGRNYTWFGVKDGLLYVTNNRTWADEAGRRYGASLRNLPWASTAHENRFVTALNVNELIRQTHRSRYIEQQLGVSGKLFFDLLIEPCDYVTLSTPHTTEAILELSLKDKKSNALQQLIGNLQTYLK